MPGAAPTPSRPAVSGELILVRLIVKLTMISCRPPMMNTMPRMGSRMVVIGSSCTESLRTPADQGDDEGDDTEQDGDHTDDDATLEGDPFEGILQPLAGWQHPRCAA